MGGDAAAGGPQRARAPLQPPRPRRLRGRARHANHSRRRGPGPAVWARGAAVGHALPGPGGAPVAHAPPHGRRPLSTLLSRRRHLRQGPPPHLWRLVLHRHARHHAHGRLELGAAAETARARAPGRERPAPSLHHRAAAAAVPSRRAPAVDAGWPAERAGNGAGRLAQGRRGGCRARCAPHIPLRPRAAGVGPVGDCGQHSRTPPRPRPARDRARPLPARPRRRRDCARTQHGRAPLCMRCELPAP